MKTMTIRPATAGRIFCFSNVETDHLLVFLGTARKGSGCRAEWFSKLAFFVLRCAEVDAVLRILMKSFSYTLI